MTEFSVEVTAAGLRSVVGPTNTYREVLSAVADATDTKSGYLLGEGVDLALMELFHVAGLVKASAAEGYDNDVSMFLRITPAGRSALSAWEA
jgi:hypothetical protein